jgi:hypothetical protein
MSTGVSVNIFKHCSYLGQSLSNFDLHYNTDLVIWSLLMVDDEQKCLLTVNNLTTW